MPDTCIGYQTTKVYVSVTLYKSPYLNISKTRRAIFHSPALYKIHCLLYINIYIYFKTIKWLAPTARQPPVKSEQRTLSNNKVETSNTCLFQSVSQKESNDHAPPCTCFSIVCPFLYSVIAAFFQASLSFNLQFHFKVFKRQSWAQFKLCNQMENSMLCTALFKHNKEM